MEDHKEKEEDMENEEHELLQQQKLNFFDQIGLTLESNRNVSNT